VSATLDNMEYALCVLDSKVYKHTLRMYNNYCFSTTKMVERTRVIVTLYVQYSTIEYGTLPHGRIRHCKVRYGTVRYSTAN
jgi:hypothetical protein